MFLARLHLFEEGGRPENLPPDFTPDFWKLFCHENSNRESCGAGIFSPCSQWSGEAILTIKSTVGVDFCYFVANFRVGKNWFFDDFVYDFCWWFFIWFFYKCNLTSVRHCRHPQTSVRAPQTSLFVIFPAILLKRHHFFEKKKRRLRPLRDQVKTVLDTKSVFLAFFRSFY